MIRVVIADDHAVVRRGLAQLLAAEDDIEVVGLAQDGAEAHALLASATPDVFLMTVTAEGVETEGQREFLRLQRCDTAQGYLFARPMPGDQVLALLGETGHGLPAPRPVPQQPDAEPQGEESKEGQAVA